MKICYSRCSEPSARKIAGELKDVQLERKSHGWADVNWGRADTNATLNTNIRTSTNKRRMRELFREHGVPMPELIRPAEGYWGVPVLVGRPDQHTGGRGFWLCRNLEDVRRALRGTRRKRAATHFMEYIDAPREYRVHIFLGKSIRISEKSQKGNGYVTIKPQHSVKHVRKAAKQAVAALGLDFGAVDILASDTDCWVTEVNAAPGVGGSMPALYAETFKKWKRGEI